MEKRKSNIDFDTFNVIITNYVCLSAVSNRCKVEVNKYNLHLIIHYICLYTL